MPAKCTIPSYIKFIDCQSTLSDIIDPSLPTWKCNETCTSFYPKSCKINKEDDHDAALVFGALPACIEISESSCSSEYSCDTNDSDENSSIESCSVAEHEEDDWVVEDCLEDCGIEQDAESLGENTRKQEQDELELEALYRIYNSSRIFEEPRNRIKSWSLLAELRS